MNLVKKVKEFKINGQDYIMTFDMRSIPVYKLQGIAFYKVRLNWGNLMMRSH